MRIGLIVAVAVVAAQSVTTASAAGCNLGAVARWVPFKGAAYQSEAYSNGATCAGAVVTIVIRARNGEVLWTDSTAAKHLLTFADAKTPKQMKAGLADWLSQSHTFKSSGDLPAWKKDEDAPATVGEFPFYPEEGMEQAGYSQIRAEKRALFCYVQGMESLACIAIDKNGAATKVGVQSFPG